ncbi:MAG: NAD(P)/FAD-dependent oxidoreductase [Myxococcales bacterium]
MRRLDVVIVGAGPNGLTAGIALQRAGLETLVLEQADRPGGGARTSELTLPGFRHDDCSSVHPLALASPFFRDLGLERYGLQWVHPSAPLVHALNEDEVVSMERSVSVTAHGLGADRIAYEALMGPFVEHFHELAPMVLGPLRWPTSPLFMARFGLQAIRSLHGLAGSWFSESRAAALLAGIAAHAMVPLERAATASFALVLGAAAHAVGWPVAVGGSQAISDALLACYRELGGELCTGRAIRHASQLPAARCYVYDLPPRHLLDIAGDALPAFYRARLRQFRHGPGVCKVDWALDGPIPWRNPLCARAATVHLSGTLSKVGASERAVHAGRHEADPFVLLVQASLFDASRAPPGEHTGWAYCHVPAGSEVDQSAAIEAHVERFAPGFRGRIRARHVRSPRDLERYNPNCIGGDISGGSPDLAQLFFRPVARVDPYRTPAPNIFLCSASTPPGGGVHGMCGYWCARSVLAHWRRLDRP